MTFWYFYSGLAIEMLKIYNRNGKAYNIYFWKMKQKIDMLHALELHFPSLHFFKLDRKSLEN